MDLLFIMFHRMEGVEQQAVLNDTRRDPVHIPLIAGGLAGTMTDISLFPLDTLKTRLQAASGPISFRGLYQGLGPAALASAPSAAIFFASYDGMKRVCSDTPWGHGQAAAVAEVAACLFKVPFEVAKQRLQAGMNGSAFHVLSDIYKVEGLRGCYTGFFATMAREIPFGFIQMPIYEFLKRGVSAWKNGEALSAGEAAGCGAVAGGIAAAATCPIDVWKTRLMLGDRNATITRILKSEGISSLFAGVTPRVLWISLGGSIFFGAYEFVASRLR